MIVIRFDILLFKKQSSHLFINAGLILGFIWIFLTKLSLLCTNIKNVAQKEKKNPQNLEVICHQYFPFSFSSIIYCEKRLCFYFGQLDINLEFKKLVLIWKRSFNQPYNAKRWGKERWNIYGIIVSIKFYIVWSHPAKDCTQHTHSR